mmetsp:Transcript_21820/g.19880  ORF Transcript_21820/g.19880 Transcript_21820/m.19880 type:complete len:794 (+) Transcript_21820:57-2438(+)
MSVVGLDVGNQSILIAHAGKGGVDVILNESSNRQTPTYLTIQGKQRFYGDASLSMSRTNITNSFSILKLLVGRKFSDPAVKKEIDNLPFKTVELPSGGVGAKVVYDGNETIIPVEHLLAMLLIRAKQISAEANSGVNIGDAVLAVPAWFTDNQRRGLLVASEIAQLNTLKVVNESTAIALSYGIFKSAKGLFSETDPTYVMFIDIGYTGYSVSVVSFKHEKMSVLSTVSDRELGGRDFDNVIVKYLVEKFKEKTGIDVSKNTKALLKLLAAAEKAKKTLSPTGVSEANVSVECLADDRDLSVVLTRDEFESRSAHLVARLRGPVEKSLAESGIDKTALNEVEIVGGTTRISLIKRVLGEILSLDPNAMNYGLKTTMNSDEAVARGSALQCAIVSSRMRVKPFTIEDKLSYGVVAYYDVSNNDQVEEIEGVKVVSTATSPAKLYARNDNIDQVPRYLTFSNKSSDFNITLSYDDSDSADLPEGENKHLGTYTIHVPSELVSKGPKDIRVVINTDRNGLVTVVAAQLLEKIADAPPDSHETEKFKKIDLSITRSLFTLSHAQIKDALELESKMAFEDKLIQETANKRNELESYIYSMRNRIDQSLKIYSTSSERETFHNKLNDAEEWLYGDGFESTKQQYQRYLDEIRILGDKIETRESEEQQRPAAAEALKRQIELGKQFSANRDKDHEHITDEERTRVRNEVTNAENWLYDQLSKQGDLPKHSDPIITVAAISKRRSELSNVINPIINKPKPKAPEPEAKPETKSDAKPESKSEEKNENPSENKGGPEPMETE